MSATLDGLRHWSLERDRDGHRDYTVIWQVSTTDTNDGPAIVLGAAGLPIIGATWAFNNDNDPWAYCWPTCKIRPRYDNERQNLWDVEQTFTTRPFTRCQDNTIQNPLAEPPRIGGSFIKFTKRGVTDRFGNRIQNPAFEPILGPQGEFDDNRPTVQIGFNTLILPLVSFSQMMDNVNDSTLWGLPARTVKLCNVRWSRNVYGTCSYYYTVDFEFEINYNTWDRVIQNDATKVLRPGGTSTNPKDFIEATRPTILKSDGTEWDGTTPAAAPTTTISYYPQSNLLTLGIPTAL